MSKNSVRQAKVAWEHDHDSRDRLVLLKYSMWENVSKRQVRVHVSTRQVRVHVGTRQVRVHVGTRPVPLHGTCSTRPVQVQCEISVHVRLRVSVPSVQVQAQMVTLAEIQLTSCEQLSPNSDQDHLDGWWLTSSAHQIPTQANSCFIGDTTATVFFYTVSLVMHVHVHITQVWRVHAQTNRSIRCRFLISAAAVVRRYENNST